MHNRIDSFVVAPGALTAWAWIPALESLVAVSVGVVGLALVLYRLRVAHIDLKLKKAEAAARGIEL